MAKQATDNLTLITLLETRDLVVETLQDPLYSGAMIIGLLCQRSVRWHYELAQPGYYRTEDIISGRLPPRQTLEQEAESFWSNPADVHVNWEKGCAHKPVHYRVDDKTLEYKINLFGIRLVREDVVFQLEQLPRKLVGEAPVPADPSSSEPTSPAPSDPTSLASVQAKEQGAKEQEAKSKRNPTSQQVWDDMETNPNKRDNYGYATNLWTRRFKNTGIKLHTIQNHVATHRKAFAALKAKATPKKPSHGS
jgi:hypothetical protein